MASVNKLIAFFGIGSGGDPSRRYVQLVEPRGGWSGFVVEHMLPLMQRGIRRFLLWMPHGRETRVRKQLIGNQWIETNLRYDAWKLAQKNRTLTWLTEGFAEAIYPLTNFGVEVIAYVGTLHGAPEYDRLSQGQARWEAVKAISPFLDAGCSIAVDSSNRSKPGHYVYELTQSLKQSGIKYYIEATPFADTPHWFNSPCIVSELQWANVINPVNHRVLAAPSKLKGEIVRGWFQSVPSHFPTVREWYNWTVPAALRQGHTCCLPLTSYLRLGGSIGDLL